MRILFLAHTPIVGTPFKVGSHHLSRELSQRGHDVVHYPPPRFRLRSKDDVFGDGLTRAEISSSLREVRDVLWVPPELLALSRPKSWRERHLSRLLAKRLLRAVPDWALPPDVVVVDKVHLRGIAAELAPDVTVFRPTDWFGFRAGSARELAESLLCRQADLVVATSQVIVDRYQSRGYSLPAVEVIQNGVELERFQQEGMPSNRERRAVYVGALDERFDFAAVAASARVAPDWQFDLFGPTDSIGSRENPPPNVHFWGPLAYEKVPGQLWSSAVGILPLTDSAANAARSPMKYYEYRAAGLPVVASRTAELESRDDPGLFLYDGPTELAHALRQANDWTPETAADLESHGWSAICDRFEAAICQVRNQHS